MWRARRQWRRLYPLLPFMIPLIEQEPVDIDAAGTADNLLRCSRREGSRRVLCYITCIGSIQRGQRWSGCIESRAVFQDSGVQGQWIAGAAAATVW